MTTKKNIYYKFMAWIARTFLFKKRTIEYDVVPEDGEIAIFVPNHSGAMGPSNMCLYFDQPFRPWIISYLHDKKVANNFIFHNFFNGRAKKCKAFWRLLAKIVRLALVPLLEAQDPIWIEHSPSGIIASMKESVKTLNSGKNLVIFAENNRAQYSEYINTLNEGFIDVARQYYRETKNPLKFYPVYIPDGLKVIRVGKPVEFDGAATPKSERHRIALYIADNITEMAKALPEHKKPQFVNQDFNNYYSEFIGDDEAYFKFVNQKHSN